MQREVLLSRIHADGPEDEVLITCEQDSITRSSLKTLDPGTCLNDEIINFYLKNCLSNRETKKVMNDQAHKKNQCFFSTFFIQKLFQEKHTTKSERGKYYYDQKIQRWGRKQQKAFNKEKGFNVFAFRRLFFPRNIQNIHWGLVVVDFEQKTITYYDSMGGTERSYMEGIQSYLQDQYMHFYKKDMDMKGWSLVMYPRGVLQQENSKCIGC